MENDITLFASFKKSDSDKHIVEGWASTEAVDSQGEIVKVEGLEKALPEYMKYGNIREMHQWSAVGKTLEAKIGEDGGIKGMWIKSKIIDKNAWEKVKEGVYNGFSIGGKVLKRIGNTIYDLAMNEISLVDRPSNPKANFSLIKFQGGKIMKEQDTIIEEKGIPEFSEFIGIRNADKIMELTEDVRMMIMDCESRKRSSSHLKGILSMMKEAAIYELKSEKEAIDKVLKNKEIQKQKRFEKLAEIKKMLSITKLQSPQRGEYFKGLRKAFSL